MGIFVEFGEEVNWAVEREKQRWNVGQIAVLVEDEVSDERLVQSLLESVSALALLTKKISLHGRLAIIKQPQVSRLVRIKTSYEGKGQPLLNPPPGSYSPGQDVQVHIRNGRYPLCGLPSPGHSAYVFGQMRHPASVPYLIQTLTNTAEVSMVGHECAEALGSIATPECMDALEEVH
ncbi:hypothetical protein BJ742DRAFT_773796 [Cladochytrium replicatum]|nr:hypothetical protein BJ742DRAFT_773796 [Cladochytrium replicatum]